MIEDVAFIARIVSAYDATDHREALRRAFAGIREWVRVPKYRRGLVQFEQWMRIVAAWAPIAHGRRPRLSVEPRTDDKAVALGLFADLRCIAVVRMFSTAGRTSVRNLKAARYQLVLETGRVLWDATLTDDDLQVAPPAKASVTTVAATTGEAHQEASQRVTLLGGALVVQVLRGFETGVVRIAWDFGSEADSER